MAVMTPEISHEFMEKYRKPFKKEFTPERVAKEIALTAFSDIADYLQIDEHGSTKPRPFNKIKGGKTRAIKKIREKRRIFAGKEDDSMMEDTLEYELYDKLKALEMGVKLAGYEPAEKHNHEVSGQVTILKAEEIKKPKKSGMTK